MSADHPLYDPATHPRQAGDLALLGATDKEIYAALGIPKRVFYEWLQEHPQFSAEYHEGSVLADGRVARSLYDMAIGNVSIEATHIAVDKHGNVTETPYTKHIPPSESAAAKWLAQRRPKQWSPQQEPDVGDAKVLPVMVVPKASLDEWQQQAAEHQNRKVGA